MEFQLQECVWEVTLACPFSCKYCGSKGGKARPDELTTAECIDVARQLAELGCTRVSLIGGEVFMRQDWSQIVRSLTEQGIKTCIITNGFLFDDERLRILGELQIESVCVSVDGPERIHDKYRQEGSYKRAMNGIERLKTAHIPVSVITTLHAENVGYLDMFYQILKNTGIFAWQLQACSPMGNAAKQGMNYRFDSRMAIDFVKKHLYDAPFLIGVADNIGYYTEEEGYIRGNASGFAFYNGCSAGISSIGIDSVGNVRGCESMYDERFNEGNLRNQTLREIWESPDAFSYNRKFRKEWMTGKCGTCEYGSYCAGGCRSYNYFVHGKLYEAPFCVRNEKEESIWHSFV